MRRLRPILAGIVAALIVLPLLPALANPAPAASVGSTSSPSSQGTTPKVTPTVGSEVVSLRTEKTTTFSTATPGVFLTKVFSRPVHYLNASGTWSDIDPTLVDVGGGRFQTSGTKNATRFAGIATDPALGRLVLDSAHSVAFGLAGAAPVRSTPSGNSISYRDILPSTDVTLHAGNAGMKEDIVLHSAAAPSVFVFPLVLQGVTASVASDGEVLFTDAAGAKRAIIPQGYMQDSADPVHHVGAISQGVTYTVVSTGAGLTALKVSLDQSWLKDPSRVYPVVVDPTTSNYTTGEDDTYVMSNFMRDNAYDSVLKVGTYDGGGHIGIAFMNFDLSSLNGMIINSATFYAYENYAWSCSARPMAPYQVTQGWGGHSMQSYPGATLGQKLGYDPSASFAMGYSSSCPANWAYWDVTNAVTNWTNGTWGQYGIAMKVDPGYETDDYSWKNFLTEDYCGTSGCAPVIGVTWSAPSPPSAPQSAGASVNGSGSASVTWSPPASNGGANVDSYAVNVFYASNNSYAGIQVIACGTCTSATVSGLSPGTTYWFGVYAHNSAGYGNYTPTPNLTAATTPSAPQGIGAAVSGVGAVTVSWSPPASNGYAAIDSYVVYAYNASTGAYSGIGAYPANSPQTLTGLSPGTTYYFTVYPHNAAGWGAYAQTANVAAASTPGAPQNVAAAANGAGAATVVWSAPGSTGGSPITSYGVSAYYDSNHTAAGINATVCGTCSQATLSGLTAGTNYYFAVSAQTLAGTGAAANSNTITASSTSPAISIFAPTNVVATGGNTQATLTWTAPALNLSGLTTYSVSTYKASDGTLLGTQSAGTATNAVVTSLTNGVSVTFTVTASLLGLTGQSLPSNAVTPAGPPFAPTGAAAIRGDQKATVSWSAPSNNGSQITSYTVTTFRAADNTVVGHTSASANPGTVTGLTNGTAYYFTVPATNAVGDGPESASTGSVTPAGLPFTTSNVGVGETGTQVTVTWSPPNNNGSPITSYKVVATPNDGSAPVSAIADGSATSLLFPYLQVGVTYTFSVIANNGVGASSISVSSGAMAQFGPPSPPTNVAASVNGASATVSWAVPTTNGSPITGYVVTAQSASGHADVTATGSDPTATQANLTNLE